MSLKVDVSLMKLIYVIFEFVLLRITVIYLTKHRCIHVRNFVRKKPPYLCISTFFLFPDPGLNLLKGFDFFYFDLF